MQWSIMELRDLERKGPKVKQNWWREIFAVIVLIILSILIWVGYKLDWTGFGRMTLWDWIRLLIIPTVIAGGAIGGATGGAHWLNKLARQRGQDVSEQRAQMNALQAYIDKMTELLLDKKLRESEVESEVRVVARARTLTELRRLNIDRKGTLLQFLYEANLIDKDKIVINLGEADLSGAYLSKAKLIEADLSKADLRWAILSGADLSEAKLNGTNLSRAILSEADLSKADLSEAKLIEAKLSKAKLNWANLSWADLRKANLSETKLSNAKLSKSDLSGADLSKADLSEAILSEAKYTKNSKYIRDTMWPEGFDPVAAGAICVNE